DPSRGSTNGCDPLGDQPICNAVGVCGACNTDQHCGALYPETYPMCIDGYCQACRPTDNQGCDISSDAPVCVRTEEVDDNEENDRFSCGLCTDHEACRRGLAPEVSASVFCQNGRCSGCVEGPTNEGCDRSSRRPFCDDGQCRGCEADQECPLGDDGVTHQRCDTRDGTCRACLSYQFENSGCDVNSVRPICDFETNTCRGCNDTLRCALIGGPPVCVDGACRECDPDGSIGCSPDKPVCSGFRCGPCTVTEQCRALDPSTPYCVEGRCSACDPATHDGCDERSGSVCDRETRTCRQCRADSEAQDCPAATPRCVDGICRECSPFRVDDCPARDPSRPVCDRDQKVCLACSSDLQCGEIDADKSICLPNGACAVCNVSNAEGCPSVRPICRQMSGEPACVPCSVNAEGDADCAQFYGANSMCVNGRCEG
ncbi:MAG: hypothetical protein VX589_01360, partial [Myxococcota bacterium]|nr:hypothetical protein [Myxococcota bacterium]